MNVWTSCFNIPSDVKDEIVSRIDGKLDLLQFAYQAVEDALS